MLIMPMRTPIIMPSMSINNHIILRIAPISKKTYRYAYLAY